MTIKPEIEEEIALCANSGNQDIDMTLVQVRTGGDGAGPSSVAKHWVKNNLGVPYEDITNVKYAGRADNGFDRVYLVTWRIEPEPQRVWP